MQLGRAALLEGDLDDVEVPRDDRLGEDRARLARRLGAEVAVGEVREGEHRHSRVARELGRRLRGRVRGLLCALALVLEERRVVDEQVCAPGRLEDARRRRRVTGNHHGAARPGLPEHLVGCDDASLRKRDGLAALERTALWTVRDVECIGRLDVEAARPGHPRSGA